MSCEFERDRLSAYYDGELAEDERQAVAAHLSECADCRKELAEIRATSSFLRSIPRAKAPPSLAAYVREAHSPRKYSPRRLLVPLAAAACALFGFTVYLALSQSRPSIPLAYEVGRQAPSLPQEGRSEDARRGWSGEHGLTQSNQRKVQAPREFPTPEPAPSLAEREVKGEVAREKAERDSEGHARAGTRADAADAVDPPSVLPGAKPSDAPSPTAGIAPRRTAEGIDEAAKTPPPQAPSKRLLVFGKDLRQVAELLDEQLALAAGGRPIERKAAKWTCHLSATAADRVEQALRAKGVSVSALPAALEDKMPAFEEWGCRDWVAMSRSNPPDEKNPSKREFAEREARVRFSKETSPGRAPSKADKLDPMAAAPQPPPVPPAGKPHPNRGDHRLQGESSGTPRLENPALNRAEPTEGEIVRKRSEEENMGIERSAEERKKDTKSDSAEEIVQLEILLLYESYAERLARFVEALERSADAAK